MTPPPGSSSPAKTVAMPPPERLFEMWNQANDVLYSHDLGGRFTAVNATGTLLYGFSHDEFLAMSIKDLVDPAHLGTALGNMQAKASGATERTAPYDLLTRAKDGRPVWVEVSTRIIHENGRPVGVQGAARDITARKEAEAAVDLVQDLSMALHEAKTFEDALDVALARVGQAGGWAYAEAWAPDADGKVLTLSRQWMGAPGLEKFSRLSRQMQFAPAEGVPGTVWRSLQPVWVPDIVAGAGLHRKEAALAAGARSVFAVPVTHAGRFVATLLFHHREVAGERARALVQMVAMQLGAAFSRRLEVDRVRSAGRLFAAQFEAVEDALLMLDAGGTPRQANRAFLELCGASVTSTDAAVPLTERLADRARFLADVATLYEDRGSGRDQVMFQGKTWRRSVAPLRARDGTTLGVLLRLRHGDV